MLLRLESRSAGSVFAEAEKAPDLIAELGNGLIVRKFEVSGKLLGWHHIYRITI